MAFCTQVVPSSGDAQEKLAKIQRTHLGYLRLDENNDRLRIRKVLEELIASHLSTVPHKEKFPCPKFLDILLRSIEDNHDFNASKASQAFDALEKYAVNLLCQPWRQEYHCIRLYSGFYQHHIEMHLRNAQEVLYMMGYEPISKMVVCLSEPIDPDKVVDVSLNCLIAAVECQIMMQIMEKVGGEFSWRSVGYVRRHNVCDVAKAVHILRLKADKRGRTVPSSHEKGKLVADSRNRPLLKNNGYVKVEKLVDVPCTWSDSLDIMEADQKYPMNAYGSYWERKPTANGHHLENLAFKPQTLDEHITASHNLVNDMSWTSQSRANLQTRDDCWGFVEQTLERKGYNKDHGERGDLLKGFTSCEVNPAYVDRSGGLYKSKPVASHLKCDAGLDDLKPPARVAVSMGYEASKRPNFSNDVYALSLPHAALQNENLRRCYAPPCPYPVYGHHPSQLQNLINLEPPVYSDVITYLNCLSPKIMPEHVCRTTVPYSCPPLTRSVVDPVYSSAVPTQSIRTQPQPPPRKELQSVDVVDARGIGAKKSRENRRSWYDNIVNDDGTDRASVSVGMPSADKVMVHLEDQIVLPPPMPFQSEPSAIPVSAMETSSLVSPYHRRRASDGVAHIVRADVTGPLSQEKQNSISHLDNVLSSKKSSLSATAEVHPTAVQQEEVVKSVKDTPRRGSSSSRHERSPSVGSVQRGSTSSCWNCWACTYLNRPEREICEMCSRSRKRGAECSPLTSGGHECQQCTLVNVKGAVKCEACGLSLENSPTYV